MMKKKRFRQKIKEFWEDETGSSVVEVILIIVIVVGLIVIFRNQMQNIVQSAFSSISSDVGSIVN